MTRPNGTLAVACGLVAAALVARGHGSAAAEGVWRPAPPQVPPAPAAGKLATPPSPPAFMVTSTADAGPGSLREAITDANEREGAAVILFDARVFAKEQTITTASELPPVTGDLTIDGYIPDRLWSSSGAVINGAKSHRVFRVASGARGTIRYLTIAHGSADRGGGILNEGILVVSGVTFVGNVAAERGGALANEGGTLTVVNSTFAENTAAEAGGGLAHDRGAATVTHCTFAGNGARKGGGLFAAAPLTLRNTILADSREGPDCVLTAALDPSSTHNLIEANGGCGEPIVTSDPGLRSFGYYNGPTKTLPVIGGSPAINLADNKASLDENGQPLVWDQRGNGDPRFVAGYADIGAFEHQAFPRLVIDTIEDSVLRACTPAGRGDCPLRGAIELANATEAPDVITFDPAVFAEPQTIVLTRPLPQVTAPLTIDARQSGGVAVSAPGGATPFSTASGIGLSLLGLTFQAGLDRR